MVEDRLGSVAIISALVLPLLLLITVGAVDTGFAIRQKSGLQRSVDAATLAAARELSLSNSRKENVQSVVPTLVENYIKAVQTNGRHPTVKVSMSDVSRSTRRTT